MGRVWCARQESASFTRADTAARASLTAARALARQTDAAVARATAADRRLSVSRAALSAALLRKAQRDDDYNDPWRTDTDVGAPGLSVDAATLFSLTLPADERMPPPPHLLVAATPGSVPSVAVADALPSTENDETDAEEEEEDEHEQARGAADSLAATPEDASPWEM